MRTTRTFPSVVRESPGKDREEDVNASNTDAGGAVGDRDGQHRTHGIAAGAPGPLQDLIDLATDATMRGRDRQKKPSRRFARKTMPSDQKAGEQGGQLQGIAAVRRLTLELTLSYRIDHGSPSRKADDPTLGPWLTAAMAHDYSSHVQFIFFTGRGDRVSIAAP